MIALKLAQESDETLFDIGRIDNVHNDEANARKD